MALAMAGALLVAALPGSAAQAQTKIRVGKAQAQTFAFLPADVGAETGLFKQRGLDIEISNFAGDARLLQALTADALDIALGGGPTLAFVAKGAPMLAVAALADAPGTIMAVVLKDGPVKTEDDLKGRTLSVSTAGSLTYWLTQQLSRSHGWGTDGIKIATLGASAAQAAALKTNQIDGIVTETSTVFKLEEDGIGRILVRFGDRIKDFHVHVIYASRKLIERNPDAVRAFLAGWRELGPIHARPQGADHRHRGPGLRRAEVGGEPQLPGADADLQFDRPLQPQGARRAVALLRRARPAAGSARHEQALHRGVLAEVTPERAADHSAATAWISSRRSAAVLRPPLSQTCRRSR